MSQIALVSDQHDDDVGIGVIPQLLQPPVDILVGLVLANVVDKEGPDGTTVVGGGDGAITLLTGGIPDLRLDRLGVDLDGTGGEFDTDGRLGVQVELIASETTQQVGLSDARVSNQHHCWPYRSVQGLKSPFFFFFFYILFFLSQITSYISLTFSSDREERARKGGVCGGCAGAEGGNITFEEKLADRPH